MIKRSTQELEKVKEGCGKRNLKTKEQVYHAAYKVIEKHCTKRFIEIEINKRVEFSLRDGQGDDSQNHTIHRPAEGDYINNRCCSGWGLKIK
ncbi:MAG: hypothetical protein SVM80_08365 [Halobacteriota archaeon]|nr:hypothetical protein [Halobacteriota archaeon]